MTDLEKIKYVLALNKKESRSAFISDFVPAPEVKGKKQCADSDDDYFDHYFVDQFCQYEDDYYGYIYYPLDDELKEYIVIEFQD